MEPFDFPLGLPSFHSEMLARKRNETVEAMRVVKFGNNIPGMAVVSFSDSWYTGDGLAFLLR